MANESLFHLPAVQSELVRPGYDLHTRTASSIRFLAVKIADGRPASTTDSRAKDSGNKTEILHNGIASISKRLFLESVLIHTFKKSTREFGRMLTTYWASFLLWSRSRVP